MRSAFSSVTAHDSAVIGCVDGDHSDTPARELGKIVWPVVKEAMSGVVGRAMQDLEACAGAGRVVSGLEPVARVLNREVGGTLLVEDDYRVRGRVGGADESPVISADLDVMEAMDDAVDTVIEKVLESGGNVVFSPPGSLRDWGRIVLLLHGVDQT
jgi:Glu-tRNA(Gln) amidotransferase subunit E-like FAD-binding protein